MEAKAIATGGVREMPRISSPTVAAAAAISDNSPVAETVSMPAAPSRAVRRSRIGHLAGSAGGRGGSLTTRQMRKRPTPQIRPTAVPTSDCRACGLDGRRLGEDAVDVDACVVEATEVRRHPAACVEAAADPPEDGLGLDDVGLDSARHRHDLTHP